MAEIEDDNTATGVEGATATLSEIRLDEDGQPMSKSALKKLQKKEAADKKKAEKAATRVSTKLCGGFLILLSLSGVPRVINNDNGSPIDDPARDFPLLPSHVVVPSVVCHLPTMVCTSSTTRPQKTRTSPRRRHHLPPERQTTRSSTRRSTSPTASCR